jgi:hypothetical protein
LVKDEEPRIDCGNLSINKGKISIFEIYIFKMTRIEELILQRTAIEAECKRKHEAAAKGEADAQEC